MIVCHSNCFIKSYLRLFGVKNFVGKMVDFDPVGRCISAWIIINSEESEKEIQIGSVDGEKVLIEKQKMTWPGSHTETPLDEPSCGWDGKKCHRNTGYSFHQIRRLANYIVITIIIVFTVNCNLFF